MSASPPDQQITDTLYDDYDDSFGEQLPNRPRFRFLSPLTAALIALIVGGVGFFVGVRVEKSKAASSSGGGIASFAARFGSGTAGGSGAGGTTASGGTAGSASRTGGFGGGSGGFAAFFGRGAGTTGSVTAIDGNTLYVRETSGNTVKVKLNSSTTVTKSESVSKSKIFPGDEVTITGPAGSGGTVTATGVTDSGTGGTAGGGTAGTSGTAGTGGGSTSASSAVSSLFGG